MGSGQGAKKKFLSTPSARRATHLHRTGWQPEVYFYPRPPRGGRPGMSLQHGASWIFLSTPSARRATLTRTALLLFLWIFLSTPSARRATGVLLFLEGMNNISIHALREEGDIWEV